MNENVVKEQMVKLVRKYNRGGGIFGVIGGVICLLGGFGSAWFNMQQGMVILFCLIGFILLGLSVGLWTAEDDLKVAGVSMGLWTDKKDLRRRLRRNNVE